nr:GIY-YIG nuclease family protein [Wolbachia endosymbiont of Psylliodes chrysocephala]
MLRQYKEQIKSSPQSCGVYKMVGDKNKVLYVGKAKNLKSRLSDYLQFENLSERIRVMLSQVIVLPKVNDKGIISCLSYNGV